MQQVNKVSEENTEINCHDHVLSNNFLENTQNTRNNSKK